MRLSDITAETVDVTVDVPGGTITVTVRSAGVTLADVLALREAGDDPAAVAEAMSRLIVGWDLEDDDGSPLPVTVESILRVPARVVGLISEAVGRVMSADPRTAAG